MSASNKTALAGDGSLPPGSEQGPSSAPRAGTVLGGKYEVEEVLGDGGMGVVVSARHLQLGRKVALKFLKLEATEHQEAARRFMREARAASAIHSEHVARVIDVGSLDDGRPFMVMEHLTGMDMAAALDQGALTIEDAVGYILQVCEAIAEAHQLGVVHRDLKPSNLFLTHRADGTPLVKVLDFGIAKALDESTSGVDAGLTATGVALGSPIYMSPEQVRNAKNVDRRTDIWGIGAVLYELIAREPPFDADTVPALCAKIVADEPRRLRGFRPEVPVELEKVIGCCLAKNPADRYADVSQLAQALEPFSPVEARNLVARVRRITEGRHSIPGGTSSGSRPDVMADTVPSRPGERRPMVHTADGVTATADDESFDDDPDVAPAAGRRRAIVPGVGLALAVALAVALGTGSATEDAKTLTPTITSAATVQLAGEARELAAEQPAPADEPTEDATTDGQDVEATDDSDDRDPPKPGAPAHRRPTPAPLPAPTQARPSPPPAPSPERAPHETPIDPLGDRK